MVVSAVVNDDSALIDLLSDLLAEEGYQTIPHTVSATAYALVRDRQPNRVVLDLRMEQMDSGWVTLDLLRLDPRTACIPVIVCSADGPFLEAKADVLRAKGCVPLE